MGHFPKLKSSQKNTYNFISANLICRKFIDLNYFMTQKWKKYPLYSLKSGEHSSDSWEFFVEDSGNKEHIQAPIARLLLSVSNNNFLVGLG